MLVVAEDLLERARRVGLQPGIERSELVMPCQRTIGVTPGPMTVMRYFFPSPFPFGFSLG